MKLFGGGKRDRDAEAREAQIRRRESVQNAKEAQYLQRLSSMIEKGRPLHAINHDTRPKQAPKPKPLSDSGGGEELPKAPPSGEDPFISLPGGHASKGGEFSFGDIIHLRDGTIGIYNRFLMEKDYDVVYKLQPDGSLRPTGIPLAAHGAETIGRLPNSHTKRICSDKAWERDLIIYHLYEYEFTRRIPEPLGDAEEDGREPNLPAPQAPAPPKPKPIHHTADTPEAEHRSPLIRGRRFSVNFGDRRWEAVYWGHDDQGALVAHRTSGDWKLMHLDLTRFEASLEYHELLVGDDLAGIEQALMAARDASA